MIRRKNKKEAWWLATTRADDDAKAVLHAYSRRFAAEQAFRGAQDITSDMGHSFAHIRDPNKRDCLLLRLTIAHPLLTLLGSASEGPVWARTLKTNAFNVARLSLLSQGILWYLNTR